MRYSQNSRAQPHERIIKEAAARFRRNGIGTTDLQSLMKTLRHDPWWLLRTATDSWNKTPKTRASASPSTRQKPSLKIIKRPNGIEKTGLQLQTAGPSEADQSLLHMSLQGEILIVDISTMLVVIFYTYSTIEDNQQNV